MSVLRAAERLRDAVEEPTLDPRVAYVYNPLRYAWAAHHEYVARFGSGTRRVLLVGMNPGPWGMGQTGVPFGDPAKVRGWMGITGVVERPVREHPKRPVRGFASTRREPSGTRLWGWAESRFGRADDFFARFYVTNYLPLLLFDAEGRNLTPAQLPVADQQAITPACDAHLDALVRALRPEFVVGVGQYAEAQARRVVEAGGHDARVGSVLHPSPANPRANQGWAAAAEAELRALGVPLA